MNADRAEAAFWAGFLIVSVAALVIDVEVGMFGFKDSWAVPYAKSTLYEEIAGAVLLLAAAGFLAYSVLSGRARRPASEAALTGR